MAGKASKIRTAVTFLASDDSQHPTLEALVEYEFSLSAIAAGLDTIDAQKVAKQFVTDRAKLDAAFALIRPKTPRSEESKAKAAKTRADKKAAAEAAALASGQPVPVTTRKKSK